MFLIARCWGRNPIHNPRLWLGPGSRPGRRRLDALTPSPTQSAATAAFCNGELPVSQPLSDAIADAGQSFAKGSPTKQAGSAWLEVAFCNATKFAKAPAKGAMVFRPASLYWCRWNWASGQGSSTLCKKNHAGGNMRKLILAAASVAVLALVGPATAQSPIVIKFSHVVATNTPKGQAAEKFKELAEKYTDGKVKVEIYPNSTLYKDKEELEALQLGAVQMLAPSNSKFGPIGVREFEVFDLPYILPDLTTFRKVTD